MLKENMEVAKRSKVLFDWIPNDNIREASLKGIEGMANWHPLAHWMAEDGGGKGTHAMLTDTGAYESGARYITDQRRDSQQAIKQSNAGKRRKVTPALMADEASGRPRLPPSERSNQLLLTYEEPPKEVPVRKFEELYDTVDDIGNKRRKVSHYGIHPGIGGS